MLTAIDNVKVELKYRRDQGETLSGDEAAFLSASAEELEERCATLVNKMTMRDSGDGSLTQDQTTKQFCSTVVRAERFKTGEPASSAGATR